MSKAIGPRLSKEANRVSLTILNALKLNDYQAVFVRLRHLAQRSKLQPWELPAALAEVVDAALFDIEQTANGCHFALKPLT